MDSSIDDILKSIKNVISGKESEKKDAKDINQNDDVLELSDIVNNKNDHEEKESISLNRNSGNASTLSPESIQDVSDSLKRFATVTNQLYDKGARNYKPGKTVEQLVVDIMRPYLMDWLNKNLPEIVKKLVEREIKNLLPDENNNI